MLQLKAIAAAVMLLYAPTTDPDADGDGLSDFHERHKYFTDPATADSDGDGVGDGDWNERRENAYTVRAIVQVLRPVTPDVMCDDYQDARILDETDEYVELEVILYPLNTIADTLSADPNWRSNAADMQSWVRPGLTANWDDDLRQQIIAKLKAGGIDAASLDDRTLVERASKVLLDHAQYVDGFSTFCSEFVDGQVRVHPALAKPGDEGRSDRGMTFEEQWQRELFARGMFEHGQRGSCTSTAIYLNGCLRALGLPTRIVLAIPIIDASDERERQFVSRLRHHQVRRTIEQGTEDFPGKWASHTFNEVFVGGRWRRLNYERLGQNILDRSCFGLIVHAATFNDWADGNMAATWGVRQSRSDHNDAFGGPNPYSTVALSDRFGPHARIDNPPPADEFTQLTIDRAWWFHERPAGVDMRLDDPDTAGHIVVRVVEGRDGEGPRQYKHFYDRCGKEFVLRADGHADIPVRATRGYWAAPEQGLKHFYLRIEPDAFAHMVTEVPYMLAAVDSGAAARWIVQAGVTLTRSREVPSATASAGNNEAAVDGLPREITIDQLVWSDAADSPTGPLPGRKPVLLARVGKQSEFDTIKRFSEHADRRFYLEAKGHPTLGVGCGIGGVTTGEHSYLVIQLGPADWQGLQPGVEYSLRPNNSNAQLTWKLAKHVRVTR